MSLLWMCCLAVSRPRDLPDRRSPEARETCGRTHWAGQETGPEPVGTAPIFAQALRSENGTVPFARSRRTRASTNRPSRTKEP